MSKSQPTYESAYKELQKIVAQLQDELVSVDDLSEKVARATTLIQWCREKLRKTEEEIDKLAG
jgi:exodeoxyribonuclease VII small subunit